MVDPHAIDRLNWCKVPPYLPLSLLITGKPGELPMDVFSRREFLERSALLSAAAATLGAGSATRADTKPTATRSVNDKLRVAVVGVNGRGMSHVGRFLGKNN